MPDNYNQFNCRFADELVSYLYGEIEKAQKIEFESHLEFCSQCAKELASFGDIRASVLTLREEFSLMKTPVFEFSVTKSKNLFVEDSRLKENSVWHRLRQIFSPAWAFAAIAILVAGLFFSILLLNASKQVEIVEDTNSVNSNAVISENKFVPEQVKREIEPAEIKLLSDETIAKQKPQSTDSKTATAEKTAAQNQSSPARISYSTTRRNEERKSGARQKDFPTNEAGNVVNKKRTEKTSAQKVPRLVEDDETEDDSIRLADLFAEIDAR